MVSANNKRVYVRCPWCSRQPVALKRGLLAKHKTPSNLLCRRSGYMPFNTRGGKRNAA